MNSVTAGFEVILAALLPAGALVSLWERRHGKVVYMRLRESDPVREVSPRRFLVVRLLMLVGPALIALSMLIDLDFAAWAVVLFLLSASTALGLMARNYRHELRDPRYTVVEPVSQTQPRRES